MSAELTSPRNKLAAWQPVGETTVQRQRLELERLRVQREDDATGVVNDMDAFDHVMEALVQMRPGVGDSSRRLLPLTLADEQPASR